MDTKGPKPADKVPGKAVGPLLSEPKDSLESERQTNRHTAGLRDRGLGGVQGQPGLQ